MSAPGWPPGPRWPALRPGEVHVWRADLDDGPGADLIDLLQAEELRRAARIVRPAARLRWISSRASLRLLLARYLDIAPDEIPLARNAAGRPHLADRAGLELSVSHSHGLGLYALAREPVGIDVEAMRAIRGGALARRLGAAPDAPVGELLAHWTRREAARKCAVAAAWVQPLDLGPSGVAALAAAVRPPRVRSWTLGAARRPAPDSPHAERRGRPPGAPIEVPARGSRP